MELYWKIGSSLYVPLLRYNLHLGKYRMNKTKIYKKKNNTSSSLTHSS
eukprot:COSAG02_NODE_398_length_23118_cov_49.968939_22_plen_48_part_00